MEGLWMKIYMIIDGVQGFDCRWTDLTLNDNGYYKIDRDFLIEFLPPENFNILIKRGIYISGKDSESESDVYIQRLIGALYYCVVGLELHHHMKFLAQNEINTLIPLEKRTHRKIDRMNFDKGFKKSLEYEKKLQVKQFALSEESKLKSRNTLQNREVTIKKILELKVGGMNFDEIFVAMDGKICDKKIREHINLFPLAEEFLAYLDSQENKEFPDLYSDLDKQWRYIIAWEKRKNENIGEFLASKKGNLVSNSGSAFTPEKSKINKENYYGLISGEI